ncbi:MAG: FAD dependent oxidoreductase [halophilic archaeon J07HX64]|nr:MAG: FAD dependent oxidoreductase [halophilic archaeon J07HX64]
MAAADDEDPVVVRGSHGTGRSTAALRACCTLAARGHSVRLPYVESSSAEFVERSLATIAEGEHIRPRNGQVNPTVNARMTTECTIIGGGIQGVSTGLLLEHVGVDTQLVSEDFAYLNGEDVPTVASNYASASIYPVAVETDIADDELIRQCEESFLPFYETAGIPVRKQTHYYLYEQSQGEDFTVPPRMDAQHISSYRKPIPSRSGETVSDGYVCSEYMVEMPEYMPLLFEAYTQAGGTMTRRSVSQAEIGGFSTDYLINCSGYGSRTLFDDSSMRAIKGHILEVPHDSDRPLEFSYTYTPREYSHYAYMYPRKETIVFDGSYLAGDIVDGDWEGESPTNPVTVDGVEIPERLLTVNRDVMRNHLQFSDDDVAVKYGYRPYREDGLRVEKSGDIIHNYGHGGAGVSLSWLSAKWASEYVTEIPRQVLGQIASRLGQLNRTQGWSHADALSSS